MDDGLPPIQPIQVDLACGGRSAQRTAADDSGRFSLDLDPQAQLDGCSVHASLPGYRSDVVKAAEMPLRRDIAGLVLHRENKWQGDAISVTALAAPPTATAFFHQAVRETWRGAGADLSRAEHLLESALEIYPGHAEAWYQLGRVRLAAANVDGARQALRKAVEADPWFATPYEALLLLELEDAQWANVASLCKRRLAMNPYLSEARYYFGLASLQLDDLDSARAAADRLDQAPDAGRFAKRYHLRGLIAERDGDRERAAAAYRRYLAAEPEGDLAGRIRALLAQWSNPPEKR